MTRLCALERAAHDDLVAADRDVRELLFDVRFVDRAVALEDAFAVHGPVLHDRSVAVGRRLQRCPLVSTGRGY